MVMERRKSRRFSLAVPVLFRWSDQGGSELQGAGFTRDISTNGTYIAVQGEFPAVATTTQVEILLPSLHQNVRGLKLTADGYVVRSGDETEVSGFALSTDFAISDSM